MNIDQESGRVQGLIVKILIAGVKWKRSKREGF